MATKSTKKSFLISLVISLGFILLIQIILIFISSQIFFHLASTLSSEQFQQQLKYPTQQEMIINWILRVVSMISLVIAGIISAWNIKKREWLQGAIVGITWQMLILVPSLIVIELYMYYPSLFFNKELVANKHLLQIDQQKVISMYLNKMPGLFNVSIILLTTLGGLIGYILHRKQK